MRHRPALTQAEIDRVRRLYETHGTVAAAAIARVTENGLRRMRKRGWTVGVRGPAERPMPNDFAIQAAHLSIPDLARHYRAGRSTVCKWAKAVGRADMRKARA